MEELKFVQRKYGRQLLLDVYTVDERMSAHKSPYIANYFEIIFIEKMDGSFLVESEDIAENEFHIAFVKPFQLRRWDVKENTKCISIIFEKEFLDSFFRDDLFLFRMAVFESQNYPFYLKLEENEFNTYAEQAGLILKELNSLQDDSEHVLRSILYTLLLRLNRHYIEHYGIDSGHFCSRPILNFKKYLDENIRSLQKVSDYADLLKISKSKLNVLVKDEYSLSAKEVIKQRLIQEAKKDILYSNKSISEIAYHLNFSDISNFNRFFKSRVGVTPKQYRSEYSC